MEQIEQHLLVISFLLKKIINGINRTTFTDNIIPFEKNHYTCIPAIDIGSVLKIDYKRAYPQAYLGQCKHKLQKRRVIILLMMKLLMKNFLVKMIVIKKFLQKKN